ncbi:hypothetical protein [Pelagicoccus sp. SDUM812003]|uniref:hypothetical protein n=1 Tax=Pelagicoccus sp. SDUM812003 TaxID=3041267 RepID=UPI00280FA0AC|nr:hypothetical protein [Pelagicoccus sp. SDUM812003]MDQ8204666.1 hypothetical protein [Pelagicoccus sp. SDUM812003]
MNLAEETKTAVGKAASVTKQAASELKERSVEAWNSFSNYSLAKRDQAVVFLEEQVEAADEQLDELRARSKDLSAEAKQETEHAIDDLKIKRQELSLQIEKAKNATSENWEEVKLETRKKWDAFTDYLSELKSEIDKA